MTLKGTRANNLFSSESNRMIEIAGALLLIVH